MISPSKEIGHLGQKADNPESNAHEYRVQLGVDTFIQL